MTTATAEKIVPRLKTRYREEIAGELRKQFEYANRKGFRVAITAGPEEFGRGTVKVKDLAAQNETEVSLERAAGTIKDILKAH